MKKLLPVLLACCYAVPIFAQTTANPIIKGSFTLKGRVKNHPQNYFETLVGGFFGTRAESIPIARNGTFSKTMSIVNTADIAFDVDSIDGTFFVQPGDVLELNWDDNKPAATLRILCKNADRQQELDQQLALARGRRSAMKRIYGQMEDKTLTEQDKFNLIKDQFVSQIQTAMQFPITANSKKVFVDIYFRHMELLYNARLLPKYKLNLTDVMSLRKRDSLDLAHMDYQTIDETLFLHSEVYRDFIFNQVRFNKPFYGFRTVDGGGNAPSNYTLKDCYSGAAALNLAPLVHDWFLAQAIIFGFANYSFDGSEEAYKLFADKIKTPYFHDTVTLYHAAMQRLRPGSPAPKFFLKNTIGRQVTLAEFKNKVVYIDFWGVSCGPCIYEIRNHAPKLFAKYKDKDVVFVNICVDAKDKEWRDNLRKLNFDGYQLLAELGDMDPVCVDYNINAIPHYVLIDKQGRIANNNAGRPSELLRGDENEIDALLK